MKDIVNGMKKGYYEFSPVLYPRFLWVAVGQKAKDIEAVFLDKDGEALEIGEDRDYSGLTISEVSRKSDGRIGELVLFPGRKDMTMRVCCHEASHVCDNLEEAICMKHGGEPSAYLMGWIASCINMARLGDGPFVEIEKK